MKLTLLVIGGLLGLLAVAGCKHSSPSARPANHLVSYDIHDGYFVSSQFEPNATESFVVIKDQQEFDTVFDVAMVMDDKSHRLPPDAFARDNVLGVIKRGNFVCTYPVKLVTQHDGTLKIAYATECTRSDTAQFASPLIVSVPKGDYTQVVFNEDGKDVKTVPVASSADVR